MCERSTSFICHFSDLNAMRKRCVFSSVLNVITESVSPPAGGRLFQSVGPVT